MAASPDRKTLERKRRWLEKRHGQPFEIIYASNGEAAILSKEYLDKVRDKREERAADNEYFKSGTRYPGQ